MHQSCAEEQYLQFCKYKVCLYSESIHVTKGDS